MTRAPDIAPNATEEPSAQERRAALLSIYLHSHHGPSLSTAILPPAARPMDVSHAVSVLARGTGAQAQHHRVRALQQLIAGGLHADPRHSDAFAQIGRAVHPAFTPGHLSSAPPPHPSQGRSARHSRAQADLATHLAGLPGLPASAAHAACHRHVVDPESWTTNEGGSLITVLHTEFKVTLGDGVDFDDVVKVVDPLGWKGLSSTFHEVASVEAHDGLPVIVDNGPVLRPPADQTPTTGDWSGWFYEDVRLSWQIARSDIATFRNILGIDKTVSANAARVDYWLYRPLSSKVWFQPRRGGLDVDHGFIEVTRDGGQAKVVGQKHVRFTDRTPFVASPAGGWDLGQMLNFLAPASLNMWMDEITSNAFCSH